MELQTTEKINLTPDQHEHVERLINILKINPFCFDLSIMGAGKTYTTSYLLLQMLFTYAIVICPASMEGKWAKMKEKYNLKAIKNIISFEGLRSIKGKQPKHGYLFRFDIDGATEFQPTEKFMKMVDKGVLIIIDECQKAKNTSSQHHAIKALCKPICIDNTKSKIIFISGSPVNEEEHVINFLRLTYIIRHRMLKVYHKETRHLELFGAQELIDFARDLDKQRVDEFISTYKMKSSNIERMCYMIFHNIIRDKLTSVMPIPHIERYSDISDGHFNLPKDDNELLAKSISHLGSAVRFNPHTKTVDYGSTFSFGAITKSLMAIEASKLGTIARLANESLEKDENSRVVIAVNYIASVTELKRIFNSLGVKFFIIQGSVHKEKRTALMDQFQTRECETRLLIANIRAIAEGIDLDDKFGDRPRQVFIIPNYDILLLHQLTARFARRDTKSTATVRFVYGKCGVEESSILNALARKSRVMGEILTEQVDAGIKFPGSHEKKYEEDCPGLRPGEYPTYDIFKVNLEKFLKTSEAKESGTFYEEFVEEMEKMKV